MRNNRGLCAYMISNRTRTNKLKLQILSLLLLIFFFRFFSNFQERNIAKMRVYILPAL